MVEKKIESMPVVFSNNQADMNKIRKYVTDGWSLVKLARSGYNYLGVMERQKDNNEYKSQETLFLPAIKKFIIAGK